MSRHTDAFGDTATTINNIELTWVGGGGTTAAPVTFQLAGSPTPAGWALDRLGSISSVEMLPG